MNRQIFERLLCDKQYKAIKSIFDTLEAADIAEFFPELSEKDMVILFRLIPKERAAEVFTYLEQEEEEVLLLALSDTEIKGIMDGMFIDDAVDVIEEMPANVVERMLRLSGEKREAINTVLNYPEDSAGSIMTLEYISLLPTMTIGDALKRLKRREYAPRPFTPAMSSKSTSFWVL